MPLPLPFILFPLPSLSFTWNNTTQHNIKYETPTMQYFRAAAALIRLNNENSISVYHLSNAL